MHVLPVSGVCCAVGLFRTMRKTECGNDIIVEREEIGLGFASSPLGASVQIGKQSLSIDTCFPPRTFFGNRAMSCFCRRPLVQTAYHGSISMLITMKNEKSNPNDLILRIRRRPIRWKGLTQPPTHLAELWGACATSWLPAFPAIGRNSCLTVQKLSNILILE